MEIIRYLTYKEVASYLNLAEVTITLWVKNGKLNPPRHLITGRCLFTKEFLDNFIEQQRKLHENKDRNGR